MTEITHEEYFRVEGIDLGIDRSSCVSRTLPHIANLLHVEVFACPSRLAELEEADAGPAWVFGPTLFHLFGVGYQIHGDDLLITSLETDPGSGISEVYIYSQGHRRLGPFTATISGGYVVGSGTVNLIDRALPFEIAFQAELEGVPSEDVSSVPAIKEALIRAGYKIDQ